MAPVTSWKRGAEAPCRAGGAQGARQAFASHVSGDSSGGGGCEALLDTAAPPLWGADCL